MKIDQITKYRILSRYLLYTYSLQKYNENKLIDSIYKIDDIIIKIRNGTKLIVWEKCLYNSLWELYKFDDIDIQNVNWSDLGNVKVLFHHDGDISYRCFYDDAGEKNHQEVWWYENKNKKKEAFLKN